MKSQITKHQIKNYSGLSSDGQHHVTATVRYDDQCGNGHNTFSITGEVYLASKRKTDRNMISCGQCVDDIDDIADAIPELVPYLKWHLTSSDGPMHYVANTIYHASNISAHSDIDAARRCAIWPDATIDQLLDKDQLEARLADLMVDFRNSIESLGFIY